jgi:3-phenylpropionate/trans-cinnamate dioxygenase ferredoxin reductase subunit
LGGVKVTNTITVIGSGCAALESIKAMRENGYDQDIHLFSDSLWPSYNPMLVTYYASGKIDFDTLFPYGANMDFYKRYDVKLHLGSPVTKLDAVNKTVCNEAGVEINYDKCLVATGASPLIPPIEGIQNKNVFKVRTVEDAINLKKLMKSGKKRVLVVGASMVGIKMVEMYVKSGLDVYFADMATHMFPLAAHENCAELLEEALINKGVKLRLKAALNKVEETSTGLKTYYKGNDEPDEVDFIIMCIGVRANIGFIDREQVETQAGLLVDTHMQTNCEGLYAAGDVAQGNNILSGEKQIIGLWANGRYQGKTAGENMVGKATQYHGNVVHNITHYFDVDFIGVGDVKGGDEVFEKYNKEKGEYCRLVWKKGKLVGINLLNTPEISGILKGYLMKGLFIDKNYALQSFEADNFVMTKLYKEYPDLKKILKER